MSEYLNEETSNAIREILRVSIELGDAGFSENDLQYPDLETIQRFGKLEFIIRRLVAVAKSVEWGSEDQVRADNAVHYIAELCFGIDIEEDDNLSTFCLKATVDERMDLLERLIREKREG